MPACTHLPSGCYKDLPKAVAASWAGSAVERVEKAGVIGIPTRWQSDLPSNDHGLVLLTEESDKEKEGHLWTASLSRFQIFTFTWKEQNSLCKSNRFTLHS